MKITVREIDRAILTLKKARKMICPTPKTKSKTSKENKIKINSLKRRLNNEKV